MSQPVQLEFVACGNGVVECLAKCGADVAGGFALAYPQQGQFIGSEPIDVRYARRLNEAVEPLNELLEELFCR